MLKSPFLLVFALALAGCFTGGEISPAPDDDVDLPGDEPPEDPVPPEQPTPPEEPPPVEPENPACAGGPLESPIEDCAPELPASTGDSHADCVNRINQLRFWCQCLPPLQRWSDGETCANDMAERDHDNNDAHNGFQSGMCNGGYAQNECPSWGSIEQCVEGCLQMMWDEGPGSFFGGHGHYLNMTNSAYSRVACGFFDGSNGTWSVQNFQ